MEGLPLRSLDLKGFSYISLPFSKVILFIARATATNLVSEANSFEVSMLLMWSGALVLCFTHSSYFMIFQHLRQSTSLLLFCLDQERCRKNVFHSSVSFYTNEAMFYSFKVLDFLIFLLKIYKYDLIEVFRIITFFYWLSLKFKYFINNYYLVLLNHFSLFWLMLENYYQSLLRPF